ncbi:MAG TPA: hypothetical protein VMZ50_13420 [Phycisphaerae bacterium]|nr:hypothetical protein [Phycisphaerae bacterium]
MAELSGVQLVWDSGRGEPEVVAEWRLEGGAVRLVSGEDTEVAHEIETEGLALVGDADAARRVAGQYGVAMPDRDVLRLEDGAALLVGLLATYKSGSSRMWAQPAGVA